MVYMVYSIWCIWYIVYSTVYAIYYKSSNPKSVYKSNKIEMLLRSQNEITNSKTVIINNAVSILS